jgi:hypothetical protein
MPASSRGRRGDWLQWRIGELVYDVADERHIGKIRSIENSAFARVVWNETKWISIVKLNELRKIVD